MDATTKDLVRQRAGDRGGMIVELTPTGRATGRLLNMNDRRRVDLREQWLEEGGQI